jgi:hypothetical protein
MNHKLPTKELTSAIASFVGRYISLSTIGSKYTYQQMALAIAQDTKLALACELRILFALSMMREYTHPNEIIQEEVRANLAKMPGSWNAKLMELHKYLPYGFTACEKTYKVRGGKAELIRLNVLDHDKCDFLVDKQGISGVKYTEATSAIEVDFDNILHLSNQSYLQISTDPHGIALISRAMPYIDLYQKMILALAVAGTRQATPVMVGKTDLDAGVTLYDEYRRTIKDSQTGKPVVLHKGTKMADDLEQVENGSVVVIGRDDEITAITQQANADFFRFTFHYLDSIKLWSFLISPILGGTSESGSGDSNLSETHLKTLKVVAKAQIRIFANELVEQVFKPMIAFNHGEQDTYGEFPVPDEDTTNTVEMLNAISSAVQRGSISPEDEELIAKQKQIMGIG